MRENNRKPIEKCIKKLPQFTTMNVIDGQAGLVIYSSLIFYSPTIDNILNIIVLLILAGVSIAMLTGENGILTQAQNAKNKTEQSGEEEKVKLAVVAAKTDGYGTIKEEDLTDELIKYFENESNFNIEPSKNENSYLITITGSERSYYVEENGNVISNLYIIRDLDNLENFRDEVNKGNTFEETSVVLLSDIELEENWEPIGQVGEDVGENWERYRNKLF